MSSKDSRVRLFFPTTLKDRAHSSHDASLRDTLSNTQMGDSRESRPRVVGRCFKTQHQPLVVPTHHLSVDGLVERLKPTR